METPHTPRRETGENNPYFLLIQQLQGLKTLLNSPSKGKVKQLSKPPKEIQEPWTAGGPPAPAVLEQPGQGRVNGQSALDDSSDSKVQSQPPKEL